jgi:hypothetical protein
MNSQEQLFFSVNDEAEFHKQRYQDETASAADRNASGQWLCDFGLIGINGKMIRTDFK